MKRLLPAWFTVLAFLQSPAGGQDARARALAVPTATVRVVAYEANGRYLGAPDVKVFIDTEDQQDRAGKFRGGIAAGIPYGVYRIEAKQPWYYSDEKYVRVYQSVVTVVMGLRFAAELPRTSPTLNGRVTGIQTPTDKMFAKLLGVYENISMESSVDREGKFSIGGLSPGAFLLLIVNDHGILASRTLTVPYTGPALEVEIKAGQPLPQGK